MQQLVGCICVTCGERISSILDGHFCAACGNTVHNGCMTPDPAAAARGHCTQCGGKLVDPAARQRQPGTPAIPVGGSGSLSLVDFYLRAGDYVYPEPTAVEDAGEAGSRHASYHWRIVSVSSVLGFIGAVLGIGMSSLMATEAKSADAVKGVLVTPFLCGAAGMLLGVSIMCLIAPREFLAGPVGRKWMALIGTESVTVARIVCLIFGLIVAVPLVLIGVLSVVAK